MKTSVILLEEFRHEAASSRKLLERVPYEQADWKPHEKSMTLGRLAEHVAELPFWVGVILKTDDLDFANFQRPDVPVSDGASLLRFFDERLATAELSLEGLSDEDLQKPFVIRRGDKISWNATKLRSIRNWAMNHIVHHRGQLSVYLRLLDIPIPGFYGPSADDRAAMAAAAAAK